MLIKIKCKFFCLNIGQILNKDLDFYNLNVSAHYNFFRDFFVPCQSRLVEKKKN